MSILVTKSGFLSTIQDLGRYGFQSLGVNPGGAMDRQAVRLLNELLGNKPDAPVIEMHFPAGEFLFETTCQFAIGGADFTVQLSSKAVSNWTVLEAQPGDRLSFHHRRFGNRSYLAVGGGLAADSWLGSASTNLQIGVGGFRGRKLEAGDRIELEHKTTGLHIGGETIGWSLVPKYSASPTLRVIQGPEFEEVTAISQQAFLAESYAISRSSDRMGFRLEGPALYKLSETEMLSSGTTFGTIQLLNDGQLIVLMADHQTTGGYPRIATIAVIDLPLMAQLGPGDRLSFQIVSVTEADQLLFEWEKNMAFMKQGLRFKRQGL